MGQEHHLGAGLGREHDLKAGMGKDQHLGAGLEKEHLQAPGASATSFLVSLKVGPVTPV